MYSNLYAKFRQRLCIYQKIGLWRLTERKLSQYVDKTLELISRYSKIKHICDKGVVCHDGR